MLFIINNEFLILRNNIVYKIELTRIVKLIFLNFTLINLLCFLKMIQSFCYSIIHFCHSLIFIKIIFFVLLN